MLSSPDPPPHSQPHRRRVEVRYMFVFLSYFRFRMSDYRETTLTSRTNHRVLEERDNEKKQVTLRITISIQEEYKCPYVWLSVLSAILPSHILTCTRPGVTHIWLYSVAQVRAIQPTILGHRIGAGTWPLSMTTTACDVTFSPYTPVCVTAIYCKIKTNVRNVTNLCILYWISCW